jgi:hypothetical protein
VEAAGVEFHFTGAVDARPTTLCEASTSFIASEAVCSAPSGLTPCVVNANRDSVDGPAVHNTLSSASRMSEEIFL